VLLLLISVYTILHSFILKLGLGPFHSRSCLCWRLLLYLVPGGTFLVDKLIASGRVFFKPFFSSRLPPQHLKTIDVLCGDKCSYGLFCGHFTIGIKVGLGGRRLMIRALECNRETIGRGFTG